MSGDRENIHEDDTITAMSSARPRPGERLAPGARFGRYEIVGVVGEGGMGVVYEAHDPDLERPVAIKLLHARAGGASAGREARLLREARAMARLSHPNVITVFEVGTINGEDFVAMEFVDGMPLDEWLRVADRPWREILEVMVAAGRGLVAAHDARLIHRDFKPANVLVARDGRVLVTDFGLARDIADTARAQEADDAAFDATKLTVSGAILGTPAYMAPEQHVGDETDERTDQFNFCVSVYEALYGTRPFGGSSLDDVRRAALAGEVPEPPGETGVPASVRRAVERGLRVDPDDRHPSMRALLDALRHGLERGRRWLLAVVAIGVLGVGAVAYVTWSRSGGAPGDCARPAALFDEAWSPARAESVRTRFSAADGDASYRSFAAALDSHRSEWIAAYRQTCSARADTGDEEFHAQVACLLGDRARVRAFVDEFVRADAAMVEHAVAATGELGAPGACISKDGANPPPPAPGDSEQRAAVRAIRTELSAILALQRSDRRGEAGDRVAGLLERARALGYAPLVAEVLHRQANVFASRKQLDDAKATLREAVLVAEESGHAEVRARALIDLLGLYVEYSSDVAEARVLARRASAAIDAYGGDPALRGEWYLSEARIAIAGDDTEAALRALVEAEAIYAQHDLIGGVASALWLRTYVLDDQGEYAAAVAVHRRRLQLLRDWLGDRHVSTALAMESLGNALRQVGESDAARALYAEAAPVLRSERGLEVFGDEGVRRGERVVRGRVVDAAGAPVARARVVACDAGLRGDAKYAFATQGVAWERRAGVRAVESGADGSFELRDVIDGAVFVVAEHDETGRSPYLALTDGIELVLQPYGALRVHVSGDLLPTTHLHVAPVETPSVADARLEVWPGGDWNFDIDRLPAGDHLVNVLTSDSNAMNIATYERVTIVAGETATLELTADFTGIVVTVAVRSESAGAITGAGVALFRGRLDRLPANARELIAVYQSALRKGIVKMGVTEPRPDDVHEARLQGLSPGDHTLCATPIRGDIKDPNVYEKLYTNAEKLPVVCREVSLEAAPTARLDIEVPGMPRLP